MENGGAGYGIGDLSRLCGVSLRTLRFYEDRKLLCPSRVGLKRIYSEADRLRLEIIILGKRLGFTLAEVWELLETRVTSQAQAPVSVEGLGLTRQQIREQIDRLSKERAEVQAAIEELRATAARLEIGSQQGRPAT